MSGASGEGGGVNIAQAAFVWHLGQQPSLPLLRAWLKASALDVVATGDVALQLAASHLASARTGSSRPSTVGASGSRPHSTGTQRLFGSRPNSALIASQIEGFDLDFEVSGSPDGVSSSRSRHWPAVVALQTAPHSPRQL